MRRRADPLLIGVGVVSVLTYALHGFQGVLSRDLAIYAYAGQQVFDGVPPYEGVLNRAGPLAHLLPGAGVLIARVFGIEDLLGMRVLFLLFAAASVCLTYLLSRDVFRSRAAGLISAMALLSFEGFTDYASGGPREKTPMVLFLLWSAWAVHRRRWFEAGIAVSLATLVLQLAFPVGLVVAVIGLIADRRGDRLRSLVRYVVGGLVPVLVLAVYFAATGTLRTAFAAFLTINARYTTGNPISHNLSKHWRQLEHGYGFSLWVGVVGLAVLVVVAAWSVGALVAAWRRGETDRASASIIGIMLAAVVAILWLLRDFDDWPDALTVLPWAAVGFGGLLTLLRGWLKPRQLLAVTLVLTLAGLAGSLAYSLGSRDDRLSLQRQNVTAKMAALPADTTILSVNAPQALVLTRKTSPTRFLTFSSGLTQYVNDTYPGGIAGFRHWVARQDPTVITVGWPVPGWIHGLIRRDYVRVGAVSGWVWYARRALGPEAITAVKNAR